MTDFPRFYEYAFQHGDKVFTGKGEEVTDDLTAAMIEQTQPTRADLTEIDHDFKRGE